MKTFEERYTAWIDGQLTGEALSSFECELERRAEAGDTAAEVDKADALQLRSLLREHLQAPVLTNTDFFTHQMHERIDSEINRAASKRAAAAAPGWKFPALAWPFGRLVAVGSTCLFVAAALYYGVMPSHQADSTMTAADSNKSSTTKRVAVTDPAGTQNPGPEVKTTNDNTFARQTAPTPAPIEEDVKVVQPDAASPTSATTLRYDNANVLWVSGLPYLKDVSPATPAPGADPAPAVSAAPTVTVP